MSIQQQITGVGTFPSDPAASQHDRAAPPSPTTSFVAELDLTRPERLRPYATVLVPLYLFLAMAHIVFAPTTGRVELSAIAGIVAAMVAVAWWLVCRKRTTVRAASLVLSLMSGLVLFNGATHLLTYPQPQSATALILLVISLGSIVLSIRWFMAVCGMAVLVWLGMIVVAPGMPGWGQLGFILVEASVIAFLGLVTRRRTFGDVLGLQQRNRQLEETMQELQRLERQAVALRQAAEETNLLKSAFMANLSHELRTPITAVIGYTDLLLRQLPNLDQDTIRGDLLRVRQASMQLDELVNSVLDLAKIEAGRFELSQQLMSLSGLVEAALLTIRPQAEFRKNELVLDQEDMPDLLIGDSMRIRQILVNLLSNACKFTERGRVSLRIRTAAGADYGMHRCGHEQIILFEVADTGIGIAPGQMQHLFQEYRQLGEPGNGLIGTGLGLALSRKLARLMEGEILVESDHGRGSVFTLVLPLILPEEPNLSA